MEILNFKNYKDIKILEIIFHSVEGKSFKTQEFLYKDHKYKIELFYTEQSKYQYPLINSRQFVVYTADKNFRILIDKEYYEKFKILYTLENNTIWSQFMIDLFHTQLHFQKKYSLYIVYTLIISILICIISTLGNFHPLIITTLAVLIPIISSLFITKRQEKYFTILKNNKLEQTIDKIKNIIGKKRYEKILNEQKNYQPQSFIKMEQELNLKDNHTEADRK